MMDPIQIIQRKIIKMKYQQQAFVTKFFWNRVIEGLYMFVVVATTIRLWANLLAGKEVALPHQPPPLGSTQESMWLGEMFIFPDDQSVSNETFFKSFWDCSDMFRYNFGSVSGLFMKPLHCSRQHRQLLGQHLEKCMILLVVHP